MALIVRPPRPMIFPMSSGATLSSRSTRESNSVPETSTFSGSSTTERARSNTSSSSCDTSCSLQNAGDLEQLAHLVGGLGPLAEPLFSLIRIHLDVGRLGTGVVRPDTVYEPPVARAARICHHYPIERCAPRAVPSQPDLYSHLFSSRLFYFACVLKGIFGILGMPPLPICFIIFCISPNCLTSIWTSFWVVPEPRAILRTRLGFESSLGLRRSRAVIDVTIASTRFSCRSSISTFFN